jgi:toxin ParE1/3/4
MPAVRILEAAAAAAAEAAEAAGAAAWYESQRSGLGTDFREDFKAALDALREGVVPGSPWPGRLGDRGVKRILLKRFPFSLVFVASAGSKLVLAVAHHRRRPAYWHGRLARTGPA